MTHNMKQMKKYILHNVLISMKKYIVHHKINHGFYSNTFFFFLELDRLFCSH